jgi:DMSO/TMAO reductase YedYZ heme-binding membrane subunit
MLIPSNNPNTSFYDKAYSPYLQAAVFFGGSIVLMLLVKLLDLVGLSLGERGAWMIGAAFLLLYALFNSILCLSSKDFNKYWSQSMGGYAALLVGTGCAAYLFSSLSINEAGTFRWIYSVVTVAYFVFISMMGAIRSIVSKAQEVDEQLEDMKYKK